MSELIDNRAHRIRTLKEIITRLHRGEDPGAVKEMLKAIVREVDSTEIAAMEQQLIAEGMEPREVQRMCDLHSNVLREIVVERRRREVPPGHPIDTFLRENEALRAQTARIAETLRELQASAEPDGAGEPANRLRQAVGELMDIHKHYERKENLLFPFLEKYGITGPSKVMWGKDDEVREQLRAVQQRIAPGGEAVRDWGAVARETIQPALAAVEEMVYKEENILFPMALNTLAEDEWGEIHRQSPRFGWCLVEPRVGYRPPEAATPPQAAEIPADSAIQFPTGAITREQLEAIFRTLPLDFTLVDTDDRVRFFSEGDRVFARSKAILGRKVQNCHPPASVDVVERIVSDFRAGRQNVAEFWITFKGRFVHIRYFALRDENGQYLGTLEMTQDLTHVRSLDGERRLLEYR